MDLGSLIALLKLVQDTGFVTDKKKATFLTFHQRQYR